MKHQRDKLNIPVMPRMERPHASLVRA